MHVVHIFSGQILNLPTVCSASLIYSNLSLYKRQSKPIIPECRHCYLNVYNSRNEGVYLQKNREL